MLARSAGDPFEVDARFCATIVVAVVLLSVNRSSDPWILGFSLSNDAAVTQKAGTDAVGTEGVTAVLLPGVVDGNAALCASFWLTSLYNSSLLKESA